MKTLIRIKLWDQTVKTKVCKNKGKSPIWNENLTVQRHTHSKNKNVAIIELWQNDEWNANKFLGSYFLDIDDLGIFSDQKKTSRWIEISNEKKGIGRVLINFEWKSQEKKINDALKSNNIDNGEKIKKTNERLAKGSTNKQNIVNSKKRKKYKNN